MLTGWAGCEEVVMSLLDMFLNCFLAVGSMESILKLAFRHFLGGAVSSALKVGVDGIPDSTGGDFGRQTGSGLGG